jgi:hypothetical protein
MHVHPVGAGEVVVDEAAAREGVHLGSFSRGGMLTPDSSLYLDEIVTPIRWGGGGLAPEAAPS